MYKVRFNLGKGNNYRKWKISTEKEVAYYDPSEVTLTMSDCVLKNRRESAQKIYEGANKRVCAWIECKEIKIETAHPSSPSSLELKYNPRENPFWTYGDLDVDNQHFNTLFTINNKVFAW